MEDAFDHHAMEESAIALPNAMKCFKRKVFLSLTDKFGKQSFRLIVTTRLRSFDSKKKRSPNM
jgi:hypothetical protein